MTEVKPKLKITIKSKPTITTTTDVYTNKKLCQHPNCQTTALYGYDGSRPQYCSIHKEPGMINVKRHCVCSGCPLNPNFGYPGKTPLYCSNHKLEGMIDIVHKRCQFDGCNVFASFCLPGTSNPIYCANHKESIMVNPKNKPCQHEGCSKRAYYGQCGSNIALYCTTHKIEGMSDLRHKMCAMTGCSKRPSFGAVGTQTAIYCAAHKEPGMVNVNNKKCKSPGCGKKPHFGHIGTKEALYCADHKEPDMVDVAHQKCQEPGCKKTPSYGVIGNNKPTHCSSHQTVGMVDLKHHKCQTPKCTIYASHGLPGQQPTHCLTHREIGQIMNPTRRCQTDNCKNLAIYGYTKPSHCEEHKSTEEMDLIQKKCTQCGLTNVLDKYGHCATCDPKIFNCVRMAKQKKVRDFFDYHHMKYISYDKIIDQGICGKERPDFIFDYGTHMIIIEVDEHQHESYQQDCENPRMINIGQSLGMPVLFIRYNPDKYKPSFGQVSNQEPQRLNSLKQQIEYWSTTCLPKDGCCYVIYMYYDGDDPRQWKQPKKLL